MLQTHPEQTQTPLNAVIRTTHRLNAVCVKEVWACARVRPATPIDKRYVPLHAPCGLLTLCPIFLKKTQRINWTAANGIYCYFLQSSKLDFFPCLRSFLQNPETAAKIESTWINLLTKFCFLKLNPTRTGIFPVFFVITLAEDQGGMKRSQCWCYFAFHGSCLSTAIIQGHMCFPECGANTCPTTRQCEQQLLYLACCLRHDIKAANVVNKFPLTSTSNDKQTRVRLHRSDIQTSSFTESSVNTPHLLGCLKCGN